MNLKLDMTLDSKIDVLRGALDSLRSAENYLHEVEGNVNRFADALAAAEASLTEARRKADGARNEEWEASDKYKKALAAVAEASADVASTAKKESHV